MSYSKYRAKKTIVDGIKFDSMREASRYGGLKILEKQGYVSNLRCHPQYPLQEAFVNCHGESVRKIVYVADFEYNDREGNLVVEDVKGFKTKEYILKRKLFLYKFRNNKQLIFKETK